MNKQLVQEAIDFFKPIPSKLFIIKRFSGDIKNSHCAVGFLYFKPNAIDSIAILKEISRFLDSKNQKYAGLSSINDGFSSLYKQNTPKKRVIALLTDMLKSEDNV